MVDDEAVEHGAPTAWLQVEEGEEGFDCIGHLEDVALGCGDHALGEAVVEEVEHGVVEAVGVE